LPLSLYDEIGKFYKQGNKFLGCLGALFIFPFMIAIGVAPFYFEWIWLKNQFNLFNDLNLYEKVASIITVWVLIIAIYYFLQTIITAYKQGANTSS
jgi:hypothetical protein